MKKLLSLILTAGTFPVSSLFLVTQSASAFCVYNRAGFAIYGKDARHTGAGIDRTWERSLNPGEKDCCPGNNSECQNATIQINTATFPQEKAQRLCELKIGAHQALVVYNQDKKVTCKVN